MSVKPHILIVDDHQEIRELVGRFLSEHAMRVSAARDGVQMHAVLARYSIDLIVLDVMLPGEDGLSLCRNLRVNSTIPVLMLTAMGEETDRIIGLEMGADDYLAKPFNARELLARIKAILRRVQQRPANPQLDEAVELHFDRWHFDVARRQLRAQDQVLVPLSTGEFKLLLAFVRHQAQVLSRDQLLDMTRGRDATPFDRSIDAQVSRLRKKIELNSQQPELIKTVWGGGYVFTPRVST